jgi:hypothetical protein
MSTTLTAKDLEDFSRLGIPQALVEAAGVTRVTDQEARDLGIRGGAAQDMSGIIFPYYSLKTGERVSARLRRDNPEVENGKPRNKYVCSYADRKHLYFPPDAAEKLDHVDAVITLVEAEKSVLALTAWAERMGENIVPIGLGGAWGWRGRIGKTVSSNGERVDEVGPISDLAVCRDREVIIALDSNVASNADVRRAERKLITELVAMGARVKIARVPTGCNGPDDLIGERGDDAMGLVLDGAKLAAEVAAEEASVLVASVKDQKSNIELIREALDAIAAVEDKLERERLTNELSATLRGTISKPVIADEIRGNIARNKETTEQRRQEMENLDLLAKPVNPVDLVDELERFFTGRMYLPDGAALILAYYVLNTATFDVFDTVPYLCLDSAVPGCGKTRLMDLLEALCANAIEALNFSEATLYRVLDGNRGVLLIDEAEELSGRGERAELLRPILNAGYKRGGKVPRCVGESHEVRFFDVFSPKVIALIGSLNGALLDRCIVIHMEKAPRGYKRKPVRTRVLNRDSRPLADMIKSYGLQAMGPLGELYANEPDEGYWEWLQDRESELYGPLLLHAKSIGSDAEQKLVDVVRKFTTAKDELKAEDRNTAKAIAILTALEQMTGETFTPGDLVADLDDHESWAESFASIKASDDKTRHKAKAARIGYVLRNFRIKKNSGSRAYATYSRQAAIDTISAQVPENHHDYQNHHSANYHTPQITENKGTVDSSDGHDSFRPPSGNTHTGPQKPSTNGRIKGEL